MGRSSDPGRDRRRSGAGEAAVTVVQSRAGFGRPVSPWKRPGLALPPCGNGEARSKHRAASEAFGTLLVEIGGFWVSNLRGKREGGGRGGGGPIEGGGGGAAGGGGGRA